MWPLLAVVGVLFFAVVVLIIGATGAWERWQERRHYRVAARKWRGCTCDGFLANAPCRRHGR